MAMKTFDLTVHPREASGRFVKAAPHRPEVNLSPPRKHAVQGDGFSADVLWSTLDDNAVDVFLNGQCVAFAGALARRRGDDEIALLVRPDGTVLHALVVDETGIAFDAAGAEDSNHPNFAECRDLLYGQDEWSWDTIPVADLDILATADRGAGLPEQDHHFADSVMDDYMRTSTAA